MHCCKKTHLFQLNRTSSSQDHHTHSSNQLWLETRWPDLDATQCKRLFKKNVLQSLTLNGVVKWIYWMGHFVWHLNHIHDVGRGAWTKRCDVTNRKHDTCVTRRPEACRTHALKMSVLKRIIVSRGNMFGINNIPHPCLRWADLDRYIASLFRVLPLLT